MIVKAVIFDKDGVLADSERLKAQAWQETLHQYGADDGFNWYLRNLGPTDLALAKMAAEEFALKADPEHIANTWNSNYRALEHRAEPIRENLQVLASLSARYAIAVASSMDKATIETEMERFGISKYITVCVSGKDVPKNKPAPDVYLAAARALGIEPSNCLAIEDTPTGVAAAKAAGMYCIGYKNPLYDLDLSKANETTSSLSTIDAVKSGVVIHD